MPREQIHSLDQFNISVAWGSGGDSVVNVGIVMVPAQTSDQPQNLCEQVAAWQKRHEQGESIWFGHPDAPGGGNSLYAELGRDDINKLIRTLRRARDQAYGRDE